jgi:hypothetical protein
MVAQSEIFKPYCFVIAKNTNIKKPTGAKGARAGKRVSENNKGY